MANNHCAMPMVSPSREASIYLGPQKREVVKVERPSAAAPWQVVWLAEQTLRPHCWYCTRHTTSLWEVAESSVATASAAS